jgi:TatD DNase family protein
MVSMPQLIDAHSHFKPGNSEVFVCRNAFDRVSEQTLDRLQYPVSVGTHPWWAHQFKSRKARILSLLPHPKVIAIGETGLDSLRGPAISLQMEAWNGHVQMAKDYGLPLILHAVRTHENLFSGVQKANVPVLFHGFSGGIKLLTKIYAEENTYVSFGPSFFRKPDRYSLLQSCPINRWLLESDNTQTPVSHCYALAAEIMGVSVPDLALLLKKNAQAFFGRKALPFFEP